VTDESLDADQGETLMLTAERFHPDEPWAELTKLDEKMGIALNAYAKSLDIAAACKVAGVAYDTWYTWRHRHPQFKEMIEDVKRIAVPEVEDALFRSAKGGNVEAAKTILKAHDPKYRDKQVIEVVSPDVQLRLVKQATLLIEMIEDKELLMRIVAKLREIWS
jgi:hypothetical protein